LLLLQPHGNILPLRRIKKARNREVLREKYEAYIAALS
jgi:hypothetical protein